MSTSLFKASDLPKEASDKGSSGGSADSNVTAPGNVGVSQSTSSRVGFDASASGGKSRSGVASPDLLTSRVRSTGVNVLGGGPVPQDPRKFKYDRLHGRVGELSWSVTKDDRMPAEEAGQLLQDILQMFKIDKSPENVVESFVSAMFFAHTVNSGSTLQPGRSVIRIVNGEQMANFDFMEVVKKLGVDMRRFFRAYADEIRDVNNRVLKSYDPYDPVSAEFHGWIMQVAAERGLHRYPDLAHDTADACTKLTYAERAAVANSKKYVLTTVENSADSGFANPRVVGKYNSTTHGMENPAGRDR